MGHDHAQTVNVWLHSSTGGGLPDIYIGTGNRPWMVRAICDPPGDDSNRPLCWTGPDRHTVDEAVADAKAHAPKAHIDVPDYEDIWPIADLFAEAL